MRMKRRSWFSWLAILAVGFCGARAAIAQDEDAPRKSQGKPGDPPPVAPADYSVSKAWLDRSRPEVSRTPPARPGQPDKIPLIADRGAYADAGLFALGVGIPLREGQVRKLSELAIANSSGELLPAEFEKRTLWPDGSLQWVWADFQGQLDKHYALMIGRGKGTLPTPGVTVTKTAERIVVGNGALSLEWNRQFATPVEVSLIAADGTKTKVATDDGRGVYLVDQTNRRAVLGGNRSELACEVESANALRAVVRVEGWYVSGNEQVARAVMRYHISWRQPYVQIDHTFIVTKDNEELSYKEIGVQLPLGAGDNTEARFGVQDGRPILVTLGEQDREAYIFQDQYPLYYKTDSHFAARKDAAEPSQGKEAAGWAELANGQARLLLAVKDFAPQFPKELTATRTGLTAKLWAGRDGRVLDYRPATMAEDWWGKWLDRLDQSRDQRRLKAAAAKSGKPDPRIYTIEQIKALNPGCVGVARTHTLLAAWCAPTVDPLRAAGKLSAILNKPPVVQPDPRWMCHVDRRVMTPMIAKGEGGPEFETIERGISAWLDELTVKRNVFPYTGWYEWGKHPNLLYEKAEDGTFYAHFYRITSNNPYHYNLNMLQTWIRGGERKYLEEAERVNRWIADTTYIHWGGGKDGKRKGCLFGGNARAPVYWEGQGDLDEPSTEAMTGFAYEYFLRDNRRLKTVFDMTGEAFLKDFVPTPFRNTPDMTLLKMVGLYRVNQDPRLLETMKQFVRVWTDPAAADGGNARYWPGKGERTMLYKGHRKAYMLLQYHDVTRDDYVLPIIVKLATATCEHYGERYTQPFYYQHRLGAIGARIHEWTRDPAMLFWARQQAAGATEVFERFFELPADKRGMGRAQSTKPGTNEALGSYVFKGVKFKADWMPGEGLLYFSADSTPAIISLPTAIWALKGYPEGALQEGGGAR